MADKKEELARNKSSESQDQKHKKTEQMHLDFPLPIVEPPVITSSYGPDPERQALIKRLQKRVCGFDGKNFRPTMLIDPPVGSYSSPEEIMNWLKELDAMGNSDDVRLAIIEALAWLK